MYSRLKALSPSSSLSCSKNTSETAGFSSCVVARKATAPGNPPRVRLHEQPPVEVVTVGRRRDSEGAAVLAVDREQRTRGLPDPLQRSRPPRLRDEVACLVEHARSTAAHDGPGGHPVALSTLAIPRPPESGFSDRQA